ncbi:MAG: ATP-binding protein [Mucilaginibacter sp.]
MDNKHPLLSNETLLNVLTLSKDAAAIHVGEQATIQYANNAMLAIWDKSSDVIGKTLEDALPELKGQPFIAMFAKVWREGLTIKGTDTAANLNVNGVLQTFYFDFEYRAIKNAAGEIYCILHMATDVTARVLSRAREQNLAEELTAANEELQASNEELNASNNELNDSRAQLYKLYEELAESENRFRTIVKQAPIGICIIRANDLYIQEVNDSYLELVGKKRNELEHRTIWEAVPEAAEAYAPVMNEVIETGIPFFGKEHELLLVRNGVTEQVFVDFVYEPMRNNEGVYAIMVLGIEVSDKVIARRSIEEVEERVRLAVEAAEIGTFDLDYVTGVMRSSDRFNAIFGFDGNNSWRQLISAVHPEDRIKREIAHREALENGRLFYELRIIGQDDAIRWVRAQGQVYFDKTGKPIRLLGTLLDITDFKRLEQQKDDFISIASHELKTPITSLKASLQLLEKLKDKPSSPVIPKLIDQSVRSMRKISTLVDDLLNVSRTRETQLRLNKTVFNIANMIDGCCHDVRAAGKYKLTVNGDKTLQVYADEGAIEQVLVNFVNNAIKYAPDSLEITFNIRRKRDSVSVAVQDYGPGIAADKIPHLFERYYQVQSKGFNNSGLGLGLYISSEIIKKHGGQIGVDTELGEGSSFWFTLPLS